METADWVFGGVLLGPIGIVAICFLLASFWGLRKENCGPRFSLRCVGGQHVWTQMTLMGRRETRVYCCCLRCRLLIEPKCPNLDVDKHALLRNVEHCMRDGGSWQVDYDWPLVTPSAEGRTVEDLAAMLGVWQSSAGRGEE